MSNILIVSYSFTGTSRRLGRALAGLSQWTLAEVRDARPRAGALGNLRCVLDSLFRRRPGIRYDGPDPAGFDAVVAISPIWAARLAGPMRSFITLHRESLAKVAVLSVMGESGAPNAVSEVGALLGRRPAADLAVKAADVDGPDTTQRLREFIRSVEVAAGANQDSRLTRVA